MFLAPALSRRFPASARSLPPVFSSLAAFLFAGCLAVLLTPARLSAQTPGQQDTSFTSVSAGSTIFALTLQFINLSPDVFLGGDFTALNQIDSTGADTTDFVVADFGNATGRTVYTIVPELNLSGESTPKLLVGGLFGRSTTQIQASEAAQNIIRLQPDGAIDTSFNPGRGSDDFIDAILPLPDGGMVVGGQFTMFNQQPHGHIVRLDNSGAIVPDSVFSSTLTFDNTVLALATQVNPDAAGPQGQILVAGIFAGVNNKGTSHLVRLNADGTVDGSFNPNFDDRVVVVTVQPDGKILAGGYFFNVNGVSAKHLVRLNYDGSVDPTFNAAITQQPAGFAAPVAVNTITPLGDGRYYIGGNFTRINGATRQYLGRVNADGSVDDFDPGTAIINTVQQVAVDPFTNLVYVGETRSRAVNNVDPPSLIRLFGDPVALPKINLTAPITMTAHGGPYGQFLLHRNAQDTRAPLSVYVSLSGTADFTVRKSGVAGDFYFLPTQAGTNAVDGERTFLVTFPANETFVEIDVKATNKAVNGRTVTLTVQADQSGADTYTSGRHPSATVTLKK